MGETRFTTDLLEVDDEDLDLGLQAGLLLLQPRALGHEGLDLLLQFGDSGMELPPKKKKKRM
jgi:hypothetical protein